MVTIDICLATYNGEKFLEEQLQSIVHQTFGDWFLWVRDDGSSDSTHLILEKFKSKYPDKINIIYDDKGNLGFIQNFNEILKYTTAELIAFCDQDDIWIEDKLETLFLHWTKDNFNKEKPVLIYSDFSYVNNQGAVVSNSFYGSKEGKERLLANDSIIPFIMRGTVLGCIMLINRKLYQYAQDIPKDFILGHDKYFYAIANLFGQADYTPKTLVKHRIHASNTGGVKNKNLMYLLKASLRLKVTPIYNNQIAVEQLLKQFYTKLNDKQRANFEEFTNIHTKNIFSRIAYTFKAGIVKRISLVSLIIIIRFAISSNKNHRGV